MDKICALTFDDGPSDVTLIFLDKLKKYSVTASFFVIGNNINESTADIVRQCFDYGCEIQNHSLTHSFMNQMDAAVIADEIEKTNKKVSDITGKTPEFFRPPYIAVNNVMYDSIDMPFIAGCGAEDWVPEITAETRAEKILSAAADGRIFLLHDAEGNHQTAEALDIIIPALLDKGFRFVTISELFKIKNITPRKRILYSSVYQTEEYFSY